MSFPTSINIEIFAGNIIVDSNIKPSEYYEYENKKVMTFYNSFDYIITIKALNNSYYIIREFYVMYYYSAYLETGGDYLINTKNSINLKPRDNFRFSGKEEYNYFSQIHPINCKVNISSNHFGDNNYYLIEKKGFYQDIIPYNQNYEYLIKSENDSCLFYYSALFIR